MDVSTQHQTLSNKFINSVKKKIKYKDQELCENFKTIALINLIFILLHKLQDFWVPFPYIHLILIPIGQRF